MRNPEEAIYTKQAILKDIKKEVSANDSLRTEPRTVNNILTLHSNNQTEAKDYFKEASFLSAASLYWDITNFEEE